MWINKTLIALKVPRQCPLVLSINVGWKQGKAFEILEGSVLANGLFGGAAEGRTWVLCLECKIIMKLQGFNILNYI
jgi:hypothetical protein